MAALMTVPAGRYCITTYSQLQVAALMDDVSLEATRGIFFQNDAQCVIFAI